jgi:outer membrane protein TolC
MIMKAQMHFVFLLLMMSSLILSSAEGQDSIPSLKLTFDQAWEITNRNNLVIKQVEFLQKEKDELVKAAKGLYLPKIGITGDYMAMAKNISLDLTPVENAIIPLYKYGTFTGVPNPDPATNKLLPVLPDNLSTMAMQTSGLQSVEAGDWNPVLQKKLFGTVAATVEWPIYAGGKIAAANKVARIEQNEVGEISRQKEGEVITELVERYYGLCLANEAVRVRLDVLKGMDQHLADANKMQVQGLIARADVLHAQVYKAQATRELSKARRNVEIINQSLLNTLTLERDTTIVPISGLFFLDSIEPLETFKDMATTKNPLLLQVDHKKLLAQQNYNVQRAGYLPEIAIEGMVNLANKDLSPYLPDWTIGVGLKWTIFDGTARYRHMKAASFKTEQVEEIKTKAESDVATMVTKLYNELQMYHEQLVELESAKAYNEEYLRVREKAFQEDMTNLTEVTDANLALAQVRIEQLQAMYGYDLTLARLLQYSGIPEQFQAYQQKSKVTN